MKRQQNHVDQSEPRSDDEKVFLQDGHRELWFVCLLINYNVAFDRINVMETINFRQRINVAKQGHVHTHTIK